MFDLEQSIGEWRNKMLTAGIKTLVMEELESHLREEFELQILAGFEAPFAFDAAVRQIGKAPVIKMEFAKIERQSKIKTIRKILARLTTLILVFGVGLVGLFVWRQWPVGRSVDCRFQKQQAGGALGVCLRMKYLNGTCSVTTSKSGSGVGAFLSLHNGSCYAF